MDREAAMNALKANEAELRRLGVDHLHIFGSTARGDGRPDSDVDLFFDYQRGKLALFELMDVTARHDNPACIKTAVPRFAATSTPSRRPGSRC